VHRARPPVYICRLARPGGRRTQRAPVTAAPVADGSTGEWGAAPPPTRRQGRAAAAAAVAVALLATALVAAVAVSSESAQLPALLSSAANTQKLPVSLRMRSARASAPVRHRVARARSHMLLPDECGGADQRHSSWCARGGRLFNTRPPRRRLPVRRPMWSWVGECLGRAQCRAPLSAQHTCPHQLTLRGPRRRPRG
jgi:hypothetical protein